MLYNPRWSSEQIQNRYKLIALLRDRSRWPVGFHWYYGSYRTCALGLAKKVGITCAADSLTEAQYIFGLSQRQAEKIFANLRWGLSLFGYTSPEWVADRLEAAPLA